MCQVLILLQLGILGILTSLFETHVIWIYILHTNFMKCLKYFSFIKKSKTIW